jgi:hypothetical protein
VEFAGLFGQRVTVFPSLGIVVVRTGEDPNLLFSLGPTWEEELYRLVLAAVTDQKVEPGGDGPPPAGGEKSADYGFQTGLSEPDQYSKANNPDPLPPAGPGRARAAQLWLARPRAGKRGKVVVRVWCPPRWPSPVEAICRGVARVTGTRQGRRYAVPAGTGKLVRFRLKRGALRALRRKRTLPLELTAVNLDLAEGTRTTLSATLQRATRRRR